MGIVIDNLFDYLVFCTIWSHLVMSCYGESPPPQHRVEKISFNRKHTGIYFNPLDPGPDLKEIGMNEAGLKMLVSKVNTKFDQIMITSDILPSKGGHLGTSQKTDMDTLPELVAKYNLHRMSRSQKNPMEIIISYKILDWSDLKLIRSRLRRARYILDKANSIFPGTVQTVLLEIPDLTNDSLTNFMEFRRHFHHNSSGFFSSSRSSMYRVGLAGNITLCAGHSSSLSEFSNLEKVVQLGLADALYFSHYPERGPTSVEKYAEFLTNYFANCKDQLGRINNGTRVGFRTTFPDTTPDGLIRYSDLVRFWRRIDSWAATTNTSVVLLQAFDNPFQDDFKMKTNGWWRLVPNSSYEEPSQWILEEKQFLPDIPTITESLNLTWLRLQTIFSREWTGIAFNPVIFKDNLGKPHHHSESSLADLVKQVSTRFSKILICEESSHYLKSTISNEPIISIAEIVAKLNLNRSYTNSEHFSELIMPFEVGTFEDVVGLAKEANQIFPETVKLLLYRPPSFGLDNFPNTEFNDVFTRISNISLAINIPLNMTHDQGQFENLMGLAGKLKTSIIYFSALPPPQISELGVDRLSSLFTVMLERVKGKVDEYGLRMNMTMSVGFITGWPGKTGEENLEQVLQFISFWEKINTWAVESQTRVIFSTAFDIEPVGPSHNKLGAGNGWWRLVENDTTTTARVLNGHWFENKKEVALRYYLEMLAKDKNQSLSTTDLVITIVIPSSILLLSSLFMAAYLLRRRNPNQLTKSDVDEFLNGGETGPFSEATNGPYQKAQHEMSKKSFSIDQSATLGSGQFGIVCRGLIKLDDGEGGEVYVAVKMTKASSPRETLRSFLFEIKILSYLGAHPYIVRFMGANTSELKDGKVLIFLELCALGSLQSYLRNVGPSDQHDIDEPFTNDLVRWSREIASGMEYMSSMHIVHMDLATRNVLLTAEKQAKITDFGLSRRMYDYQTYIKSHQEPLPWRSMSPESLRKSEFTQKSDVWAYGVTLREIFSLADEPYPFLVWDVDFPLKLERGLRLGEPRHNVSNIYSVMLRCWDTNPERRPTFSELLSMPPIFQQPPKELGTVRYVNIGSNSSSSDRLPLTRAEEEIKVGSDEKPPVAILHSHVSTSTSKPVSSSWRQRDKFILSSLKGSMLLIAIAIAIVTMLLFYSLFGYGGASNLQGLNDTIPNSTHSGQSMLNISSGLDVEVSPSLTPPIGHPVQNTSNTSTQNNNFKDEEGNSELHLAVIWEDERLIEELVRNGADLNDRNSRGHSPLHLAASQVMLGTVQYLITLGTNVFLEDEGGQTFLSVLIANGTVVTAAQFDDLVKFLVGRNVTKLFNIPGGKLGATPLQLAVKKLEVRDGTLDLLHDSGVNFNPVDTDGDTLLSYAIHGKRAPQLFSSLIRLGTNWEQLNKLETNLVYLPARVGDLDVLKLFVGLGWDVNEIDQFGKTALHRVLQFEKKNLLQVVQFLVENGAKLDTTSVKGLEPYLQFATANRAKGRNEGVYVALIKLLIDNGADPFGKDKDGETFLHRLLVKKTTIKPSEILELVEYLVSRNYSEVFNTPGGTYKTTPFQCLVKNTDWEEETLALLKNNSVNFNPIDKDDNGVLFYAISGRKDKGRLDTLIQLGVDWKLKNKKQFNLIHVAAWVGNVEALQFFLDLGLDINAVDGKGNTPLHQIMHDGKKDILAKTKFLIENGADVTIVNGEGETALDIALTKNGMADQDKIVRLLQQAVGG